MKITSIILVCVVAVAGGIYFFRPIEQQPIKPVHEEINRMKEVTLGNQVFLFEIADTPALQERGLSYRGELPTNTGMIFIFPVPGMYYFWMKDMNFPIDIIWLDKNKKVVHIEENLSPKTYPESFGPTSLTQYVIELQAGVVKTIGLQVGDNVAF